MYTTQLKLCLFEVSLSKDIYEIPLSIVEFCIEN